ncbi:MAG TPA: hypothetical protein VLA93_17995 [Pyrinomonadaceae bacterium]|nr:hypothetical protein [Pyrinomonadaceae bacterium]
MTKQLSFLLFALLFVFTTNSLANESRAALATKAVSEDVNEAAAAIAELRSLGPAGLESLLEGNREAIDQHIENPTLKSTPEWTRITAALDGVSQQKDSYLSGLYWYTNLSEARRAATIAGKPILSLRLLGKLTDELSCANSRFFRTVLYSNATVAQSLRERFVLHWETVRPVPLITIDFGDGRKLQRTITGNSIHYILDSEGRLLDALPGLYGPTAFLAGLADAETVFQQIRASQPERRLLLLNTYHRNRTNKISLAWLKDIQRFGGKEPAGVSINRGQYGEALRVMPLAVSKAVTETTMLRSMTAGSDELGRITDEAAWKKIAALHRDETKLDERSISLIRRQTQALPDAANSLPALLRQFQELIALDTVRNEYLMHTKIHAWLVFDRARSDVAAFNEKVYAELFITPKSDPWLGLLPADVYTGLENGGVVRK